MPELHELRKLAAWFREFAERAGDPGIWERRLRTAEQLEAEADRIEAVRVGLAGNDRKDAAADRKAL